MKTDWKKLVICLGIPLAVGSAATLLGGGMGDYGSFRQPPISPPGWLFAVVWTILYLLMGYASYRILISDSAPELRKKALRLYAGQLCVNFLWPLLFFGLQLYLAALITLVALWILIYLTIRSFSGIDAPAANLLLPYLLWVTFAGYLNLGVFFLN